MLNRVAYIHKHTDLPEGEICTYSLTPADIAAGWSQEELVPKSLLDEADRRAGAAKRNTAYADSENIAHRQWLSKAKKQWGVSNYVSLDKVWEEALELKNQSNKS